MTTTPGFARRHPASIGDVIAAVPAFLGFTPERSVVLMSFDQVTSTYGATTRIDLGLTRTGALRVDCRRYLAVAVDLLRNQGTEQVVAVVVDDRRITKATPALVQTIGAALRSRTPAEPDIELIDLIFVSTIDDGQRWVCQHGESGSVADPRSSPAALSAAFAGRPVRGSRDEVVAVVGEQGGDIDVAACRSAAARDVGADPADLIWAVLVAVCDRGVGGTDVLTDATVARLGGALLDVDVRDVCLALSLTVVAADAQSLFAELARRLSGTARAAAATLVAGSAYLHRDGPLTSIALEAALRADSSYRAATLLAAAFDGGLSPADVRSVAATGMVIAARLGVRLPPLADDHELAS